MRKFNLLIVLFVAIALAQAANAQLVNQPCSSGEYCDGYLADNGQCFGTCRPSEENPCNSPWWSLWDQAMCKFKSSVGSFGGWFNSFVSGGLVALVSPDVNPRGNDILYALSYSISFTLALLLLIITVIMYFTEMFKENSSVELMDKYRSQIFKFFIMIALIFSSHQLITLFIDSINELNRAIITSMVSGGDIASALLATLAAGIGVLILLWMASLGIGLVVTVLIFLSFFIVLMLRGIVLYALLAIVPIIIVLYFFEFTQKAGDRLFKLLLAHLLISTVWVTIFAIAFDFPNQFLPGSPMYIFSSALAPVAAAVINSILYFKIVTFFGSYESAILSRGQPIGRIIERRHEIIRTIRGKRARLPQTKLTSYVR